MSHKSKEARRNKRNARKRVHSRHVPGFRELAAFRFTKKGEQIASLFPEIEDPFERSVRQLAVAFGVELVDDPADPKPPTAA